MSLDILVLSVLFSVLLSSILADCRCGTRCWLILAAGVWEENRVPERVKLETCWVP